MADPSPPDEQPAIRIIAMPADANYYGDVFGGWLMNMMDLAASSVACRDSAGRAVTVAIDAVAFHHPVHIGDEVSVYAKLASVGRTSAKIAVEVLATQSDRRSGHQSDRSHLHVRRGGSELENPGPLHGGLE